MSTMTTYVGDVPFVKLTDRANRPTSFAPRLSRSSRDDAVGDRPYAMRPEKPPQSLSQSGSAVGGSTWPQEPVVTGGTSDADEGEGRLSSAAAAPPHG